MNARLLCLTALLGCGNKDASDDTGQSPAPVDCSTRPADIPSARGEHEGAWSAATGRFVFFGGDQGVPESCMSQTDFVADTWLWESDCNNFREVEGDAPTRSGRYAAGMDAAGDRWYVHGGRFRGGTSGPYENRDTLWSFSFADEAWTKLSSGPDARNNHAGAVAGGKFVVYSGTSSTDGLSYEPILDDVWVYDIAGDSWSELATTGGGPGGRVFHSATSNGTDKVYIFGGGDENAFTGPFFSDLWELDLGTGAWTLLHDGEGASAPDGRMWADLMYDASKDRILAWGGHDDTAMGNTNQLWAFDLASASWNELEKGDKIDAGANGFCDFPADFVEADLDAPERRYGAAAALTDDGRVVIFGGKTDCGIINDLWTYDLDAKAWENQLRATDGESCIRAYDDCTTLCY